jgi:hypothetical protein
VGRSDDGGGLRFDSGEVAGRGFDDEVDFAFVGVAVEVQLDWCWALGRLLDELHDNEGLKQAAPPAPWSGAEYRSASTWLAAA